MPPNFQKLLKVCRDLKGLRITGLQTLVVLVAELVVPMYITIEYIVIINDITFSQTGPLKRYVCEGDTF